jgi:Fe2+ transport system protein FeoA
MYLHEAQAGQTARVTAISSSQVLEKLARAGVGKDSIIRIVTNHGPTVMETAHHTTTAMGHQHAHTVVVAPLS